jgi:hypothetical protein
MKHHWEWWWQFPQCFIIGYVSGGPPYRYFYVHLGIITIGWHQTT